MNLRIKITKWVDEESESPDVVVLVSDDGAVWKSADDLAEPEAIDLREALFVNPSGAMRIDVERGAPSLERIAEALPKTPEYMGWNGERVLETDDDAINAVYDDGGIPVLINGERWSLFEIWNSVEPRVSEFNWIPCDPDELRDEQAWPLAWREIAHCSGIESASMTSGYFHWWVVELDYDLMAFCQHLDEDGFSMAIEKRAGRSDIDIAHVLGDYCEWYPVQLALRKAIASGEEFDGVASELDPELSETCEVRGSFFPNS